MKRFSTLVQCLNNSKWELQSLRQHYRTQGSNLDTPNGNSHSSNKGPRRMTTDFIAPYWTTEEGDGIPGACFSEKQAKLFMQVVIMDGKPAAEERVCT